MWGTIGSLDLVYCLSTISINASESWFSARFGRTRTPTSKVKVPKESNDRKPNGTAGVENGLNIGLFLNFLRQKSISIDLYLYLSSKICYT